MRVGFFSDSYFPEIDGVAYTLKLWKERLEERGHEVHIFYPGSSGYSPAENEHPVHSVPNPFYAGYNVPVPVGMDIPELDIVHCHTPLMLGYRGRLHAYLNDIPAVYTHHTPIEEYFEQNLKSSFLSDLLGTVYIPFENLFLNSFDLVTSNTSDINRKVEAIELPVGIDLEFFQPSDENSILDEFGVDTDKPVIGYSGRISIEKNVERVAELAEKMDASVIIIGEGPRRKKIESRFDDVVFHDFIDRERLPEFYSSLEVFVTASTGDTLGLSPLEANACGTPVVAPDVYPFYDTISDGNGLRFDLDDEGDIVRKVKRAIDEERDTRDAVKDYSLDKTINMLESRYGELSG
ncbi:MAG: glycosyltransferase [Candidatus Nanohaloarchaea archaeon]